MHRGSDRLAAKEKKERVANTGNALRQAEKLRSEKPRRRNDAHIGQALRSAWNETVGEQVPADMLDLLGKLN